MDDDIEVKQFCTRYVEVMGTESDHVHIVALSDALQASSGTSQALPTEDCARLLPSIALLTSSAPHCLRSNC